MKLTAVFLIILTSTSQCKLGNIDFATPTYIKMDSIEVCDAAAKVIDERPNQRSFCFDTLEPKP